MGTSEPHPHFVVVWVQQELLVFPSSYYDNFFAWHVLPQFEPVNCCLVVV
jgi:hypothetical protein